MTAVLNDAAPRSTKDWQAADAAHYLHPFTDFKALGLKGSPPALLTRLFPGGARAA